MPDQRDRAPAAAARKGERLSVIVSLPQSLILRLIAESDRLGVRVGEVVERGLAGWEPGADLPDRPAIPGHPRTSGPAPAAREHAKPEAARKPEPARKPETPAESPKAVHFLHRRIVGGRKAVQ